MKNGYNQTGRMSHITWQFQTLGSNINDHIYHSHG